jgi:hypothetical protein
MTRPWEIILIVGRVKDEAAAELTEITLADDGVGLGAGFVKRGEKDANQYSNNANDDEEFNEGKSGKTNRPRIRSTDDHETPRGRIDGHPCRRIACAVASPWADVRLYRSDIEAAW